MALTLDQLLATPTEDEIRESLLGRLHTKNLPITDFEPGAVVRTVIEVCAHGIASVAGKMIPRIAAGGLVEEADLEWLGLLAHQNYDVEHLGATYTVQQLRLQAAVGVGPYTVSAGDLVAESTSGNRYVLDEGGTVPLGTGSNPVTLNFKAESPGAAYADAPGTIIRLITPLPGVTVNNVAPTFSAVGHNGSGSGQITLSGTPAGNARFTLRITGSGQADAATFNYSLNGAPEAIGGVGLSTGVTLPGGTVATFVNGGNNPSFVAGDTYTFSTPGSPVVAQGRDEETRDELARRMKARWAALSDNATAELYETWAREASADITKVTVRPANTALTPGRVEVIIAGAVNPLVGPVGTAQAYIDARAPITDHPVVVAADAVMISAVGQVDVYARDLARVQADAQNAWNAYLAGLPIGGSYYASRLAQILMNVGAIDAREILVGPVGEVIYYTNALGPYEVAQAHTTPLSSLLTWVIR